MNKSRAYEVLNVFPDSSATELKHRFTTLINQHHPDHGGDEYKFQEVLQAYRLLKPILEKCPKCGGTGEIIHHAGFVQTKRRCSCRIKKKV